MRCARYYCSTKAMMERGRELSPPLEASAVPPRACRGCSLLCSMHMLSLAQASLRQRARARERAFLCPPCSHFLRAGFARPKCRP